MKANKILVNCPGCGKKIEYGATEFSPFCSRSCKMKDLVSWANEDYVIVSDQMNDDDETIKNDEDGDKLKYN
ncbi:MAG: DNA gyrase inhibitor YacG [SAR324 cluster bacterium]|nr:DNA gyrase inhibitor YacG [SAR324 cluster bacterium]